MDLSRLIDKKSGYANYMLKEISYICRHFEKRAPGSKGEEQACEYMAGELRKLGCEAKVEPFKENPRSFYGWIYITITCVLLAVVAILVNHMVGSAVLPFVGICLIVFGLVVVFLQFGLYCYPARSLIDDYLTVA